MCCIVTVHIMKIKLHELISEKITSKLCFHYSIIREMNLNKSKENNRYNYIPVIWEL